MIIPAPYWVSYPDMVAAHDGIPVIVDCPEADGFRLTPERSTAAITPRTRWLDPQRAGQPDRRRSTAADELAALAEVLRPAPAGRWCCADEIYDEIVFTDAAR